MRFVGREKELQSLEGLNQKDNAIAVIYELARQGLENVCRQHAVKLADLLGFSAVNYRVGPYFRAARGQAPGVQVDLIFDRDDHVLTLCEMKSSRAPIAMSVLAEIERKREILQAQYPRHTIQSVLIYDGLLNAELQKSPYLFKTINAQELI